MHTKNKINIASRLAARGTMLINRYLSNETFEAYFNAQNKGKATDYLRTYFSGHPENLGERLATYYNLCERLSAIGIERSKEVLLVNLSDDESYSRAESGGIMKELAWLRSEFELYPKPNQKTILGLLGEEIVLLRNHADLILSLDPELEILQQFDELPELPLSDGELQKVIEGGNQIILGHELLKRINPGTRGIFPDIPISLKQKLFRSFQSYVALDLDLNNALSEAEKRHIQRNQNAFLQYLDQSDEPPMIALSALMIDSVNPIFFETANYVMLVFQMGLKYARTSFVSDIVHEAWIRLFSFMEANFDKLRKDNFDDVFDGGVPAVEKIVLRHLADSYEYLWETDKAIVACKRMMQLAQDSRDQDFFEGGLLMVIRCLENHFESEKMMRHLIAAIEHNYRFWGLSSAFNISPKLQKTLEFKLVDYLNETSISKREKKKLLGILRTEEAKVMVRLMQGIEEDNISSDSIKEAQKMVSGFYERDLSDLFSSSTTSSDEKVQALLEPLGFTDFTVEEYEKILDKIKPLEGEISSYRQLLFQLHSAKLRYLKEEIDAVEYFNQYLPRLKYFNKEITMFQKGNWYNEKLRALSLVSHCIKGSCER